MPVANVQHFLRREFMTAMEFSCLPCLATFTHHVCTVICERAKEQMSRIYTGRVIASMKDTETRRNWPISKFPRDPMGRQRRTAGACQPRLNLRITPLEFCSMAEPTIIRIAHSDLGPEALPKTPAWTPPHIHGTPIVQEIPLD